MHIGLFLVYIKELVSVLSIKKMLHRIIKLFHKWRVKQWGNRSSELAFVASVSVGEDVIHFGIDPCVQKLRGI